MANRGKGGARVPTRSRRGSKTSDGTAENDSPIDEVTDRAADELPTEEATDDLIRDTEGGPAVQDHGHASDPGDVQDLRAPQEAVLSAPPQATAQGTVDDEGSRFAVVIFQGSDGLNFVSRQLGLHLRDLMREHITTPRESTEIDLWLDSPGGDAHAAYKIGLLLRSYASHIRVVIPDYAKSAGTLLTLVADKIFMGPAAELGPLDAQIGHEGELFNVSALDRARSLNDLIELAVSTALDGGAYAVNITRISRAQSLREMLSFSAKFFEPIVSQLDPTILHWSNSQLEVAVQYGQRLLETRQVGLSGLEGLPRLLVENYPTHGFVISPEEAARLGLPVQPLDEYQYASFVLALHRRHEETEQTVVLVQELGATADEGTGGGDGTEGQIIDEAAGHDA